jgi:CheY-like chemotaxis protein
MALILIIYSDEIHAKTVASALESHARKLTMCANKRDALDHLESKLTPFDVIVFDFSNRPEDWEFLRKVRALTIKSIRKPGILCLSKTYFGPDVKLQVERQGARLLYERSA